MTRIGGPSSVWGASKGTLKVYQIEPTNRCDAACAYCPQEKHARPRGRMSMTTFNRVLDVMENKVVALHHIGEPLLHPALAKMVAAATRRGFAVGFSTNGRRLTQERLDVLAGSGLAWLRLHTDPFGVRLSDYRVPAGLEMTEHRLLAGNDAPAKELQSFAGKAQAPRVAMRRCCTFIEQGWRVVLWDGRVGLCCNDIEGIADTSLCEQCDGYVFKDPRTWGDYDGTKL